MPGEYKAPNWSKEPKYTSPLPTKNDAGKIPPRNQIKPFAGLPASTGPRPMNKEK